MEKLATFRIDEENWSKFQEYCKEKGSNASVELKRFILSCLGEAEQLIDTDQKINDCIDKRLQSKDTQAMIRSIVLDMLADQKPINQVLEEKTEIEKTESDHLPSTRQQIIDKIPTGKKLTNSAIAEIFGVARSTPGRWRDTKTPDKLEVFKYFKSVGSKWVKL